jgi:hypothetical protein
MVTQPVPTIGRQRAPAARAKARGSLARSAVTTRVVLDDQTGQPARITTDTDVAHVVADGKDVNNVRITRDPPLSTRPPASRRHNLDGSSGGWAL